MEHVHEASRLLSKSIVRVEQPDIVLQEDDALLMVAVYLFWAWFCTQGIFKDIDACSARYEKFLSFFFSL